MQVYSQIIDIQAEISKLKSEGKTIGFVPTMGALHQGHLSLVQCSKNETDKTVVSIFVNPTQFNDKNDLKNYPRTLEADLELLSSVGCDYVFAPTESEMYPEPDMRIFDFGLLDKVMEGEHRPGHFNGVAQIVSKLFDAVPAHKAFFGQKDFQQVAIIKAMVRLLNIPIQVISCPIIREADGLAMSSRNTLLTSEHRKNAPCIFQILNQARNYVITKTVDELKNWVIEEINANQSLKVEYFDIVDSDSLESITDWKSSTKPVGCIAVFAGKVRLIDNISFY